MNISIDELRKYKDYIIHNCGYRIVYFYEEYHEAPKGLYAKNIEDFRLFFSDSINYKQDALVENILSLFLAKNLDALGVAIYDINGKCILRKNKSTNKKINNSEVYREELIYDYGIVTAETGYRIVYFYNSSYDIGPYCKTLEGFMEDFLEVEPIYDDDDIPKFVSVDDLLTRYLNKYPNMFAVGLYNMSGECIYKKFRDKNKKM